jgi:DNA-binding transcriptional LysR family regulator
LSNQEQIDRIQKDKLDLGFVRVASLPEGLERKVAHRDTFSLVVPQDHPLQPADFHSLGQFADAPFILFSSDYSNQYYEQILGICSAAGFHPKIKHKSVHALTIFRLVANGMGVAIVPSSLLVGYAVPVRGMVIPGTTAFTELSMIWKTTNRNPVLGKVLGLI